MSVREKFILVGTFIIIGSIAMTLIRRNDSIVTAQSFIDQISFESVTYVYTMQFRSWRKTEDNCKDCKQFVKANLKTPYGRTTIFVYQAAEDPWVSGILINSGSFEAEKTDVMLQLLKVDNNINLIDIGANIGVYTLLAAKMGRKVLAVEALEKNVQHICGSVAAGRLQDKVIIVHNAVSNSNGVAKLGIDKNNMGGTFVDVDSTHIRELKLGRAHGTYGSVRTITIDNLLTIPGIEIFSKVVIKMDIEGFEAKAVEGASLFFKKIHIVGVIMEWEFHKGQKTADVILEFMSKHNFVPHELNSSKHKLDVTKSKSWGYDVLWLPSV